MSNLKLQNICKVYEKGVEAIAKFSIDVASGELYGIVGSAGTGKSLILKMIAGLVSQSSGSIYFGDENIDMVHVSERDIVMVSGEFLLFPKMKVRDNLAYGLKLRKYGTAKRNQVVDDVAREMDISHLLNLRADRLTREQAVSVALARVAIRRPKLVLFDEPLVGIQCTDELLLQIKELNKKLGITFIYATQNPSEAMTICDRLAVFSCGQLYQVGSPELLYNFPSDLYTAVYLSKYPLNVLEARLVDNELILGDLQLKMQENSLLCSGNENNYSSVLLAVRPENVMVGSGEFSGKVMLAEELSCGSLVHIDGGLGRVIVAMQGSNSELQMGDRVQFGVDTSQVMLFDKLSKVPLSTLPEINYLNAEIVEGKLYICGEDYSDVLARLVEPLTDNIFVGVRPEHIKLGGKLPAKVEAAYRCNANDMLKLSLQSGQIVYAVTANSGCKAGDNLLLDIASENVDIYSDGSLQRLTSRGEFFGCENMQLSRNSKASKGVVVDYERMAEKLVVKIDCGDDNFVSGMFSEDVLSGYGKCIKYTKSDD